MKHQQILNHIPDTPYARRGELDASLEALAQVASPLRGLAADAAELMKTHRLREATITIDGPATIAGTITLHGAPQANISVTLTGNVGDSADAVAGTPYYASYSGEFFWQATPDSEPFVKSGERVKSGQLVAWAMGESKDMSFGLRAETSGIIHLLAPNASKVREGESLLFSIEELD
jgi:biotin carboxyl carrier protein